VFQYDRRRHGALAACVGDASLKSLFAKDALGTSDEEKAEKAGMIKDAIDDKMAWNVTVLDAELVGYTHEKADKGIICENFVGFIQTDRQLEEMGYGLYGKFLLRLMADEVKLIRRDNYPNISRFTTDLAGISDGFTKHIDCAKLPARPQQDPSRLDWVRALLGRWLG
jgi:hypothetical protein